MNYNLTKPPKVAIALSPKEVVELKMIVQDDDAPAALKIAPQPPNRGGSQIPPRIGG